MPGKSRGWRGLAGYSPWGCKESDTAERLHSLTGFEPKDATVLQKLKKTGNGFFFPGISRKECRLANTMILATGENQLRGFPGCLADETLGSQCRGPEFSHWLKD